MPKQTAITAITATLLLFLLLAGCTRPVTIGVKSSSVPFSDVQAHLPLLEERGATLYLEVREWDIGSAELRDLLADALGRDIGVTMWPLLSMDQGPWANEQNVEAFSTLVRDYMDWLDAEGIHPEWFVVNMENSSAQMDIIKELFYTGDYQALLEILLGNLDPEGFALAVEAYRLLVEEMQGRGYKVMITTYPFMLDDLHDGDPDIQDLANVPIAGIDWDALTFTPYRTAYSDDLGVEFTPDIVYEYGKLAMMLFGPRARLAVGIIGYSGHGEGYVSPEDLALDISAAKAAGIEEIDLFHLGGMIAEGGPGQWLDACEAPPQVPEPDLKVGLARILIQVADALLDGR